MIADRQPSYDATGILSRRRDRRPDKVARGYSTWEVYGRIQYRVGMVTLSRRRLDSVLGGLFGLFGQQSDFSKRSFDVHGHV